eukprot:869784-Rhodomonas_salina.1
MRRAAHAKGREQHVTVGGEGAEGSGAVAAARAQGDHFRVQERAQEVRAVLVYPETQYWRGVSYESTLKRETEVVCAVLRQTQTATDTATQYCSTPSQRSLVLLGGSRGVVPASALAMEARMDEGPEIGKVSHVCVWLSHVCLVLGHVFVGYLAETVVTMLCRGCDDDDDDDTDADLR